MLIERRSPISGAFNVREIPCTPEQLNRYYGGALLQDAFPGASQGDREFIKTGITPEEWEALFAEEEDA